MTPIVTLGDWSTRSGTGTAGAPGASVYPVHGAPASTLGRDNDTAIDVDSGDIYEKASGDWGAPIGNLRGPAGPGGSGGGVTGTLRARPQLLAGARPAPMGSGQWSGNVGANADAAQLSRMRVGFPNGAGLLLVKYENAVYVGGGDGSGGNPASAQAFDPVNIEASIETTTGRIERVRFPGAETIVAGNARGLALPGNVLWGLVAADVGIGGFAWSRTWAQRVAGSPGNGFATYGQPSGIQYVGEGVKWGVADSSGVMVAGAITGAVAALSYAFWPTAIYHFAGPVDPDWLTHAVGGDSILEGTTSWLYTRLGVWPQSSPKSVVPYVSTAHFGETSDGYVGPAGSLRRRNDVGIEVGWTDYGVNTLAVGDTQRRNQSLTATQTKDTLLATNRADWAHYIVNGVGRMMVTTITPATVLTPQIDPASHTTDAPTALTGVTASAATDTFTKANHGLKLGDFVVPQTTAGGLQANAVYWVKTVPSSSTFTLVAAYDPTAPTLDVTADIASMTFYVAGPYFNTPENQTINPWDPFNGQWANVRGPNYQAAQDYNAYFRTGVNDASDPVCGAAAPGLPPVLRLDSEAFGSVPVYVVDTEAAVAVTNSRGQRVWGCITSGNVLTADPTQAGAISDDLLHPKNGKILLSNLVHDRTLRRNR